MGHEVLIHGCFTLYFNSLAPGRFEINLRKAIFKLILMIGGWGIFCKIALRWMSMDVIDDKSTLVQVMAWCRQATSHYLSHCWPRSMSPYGITRPQWVKLLIVCLRNFVSVLEQGPVSLKICSLKNICCSYSNQRMLPLENSACVITAIFQD